MRRSVAILILFLASVVVSMICQAEEDGTPMLGFSDTLRDTEIWELVAFTKSIERKATKTDP